MSRTAIALATGIAAAGLHATSALAASDVHLHTLASDGSEGYGLASLVKGSDGAFYGTTSDGFSNGSNVGGGNFFRLTSDGGYTILHAFDDFTWASEVNNDGIFPGNLLIGSDGAFYGTAGAGGSTGSGTIFRVTPDGSFGVLHTFAAYDVCQCKTNTGGASPITLSWGSDGALYGATQYGGPGGFGSFFRLALDGTYTDLYDFTDVRPSNLIAAGDGNFYGSGYGLGLNPQDVGYFIFKLTPAGSYSVIHQLASNEGEWIGALLYGRDGNLYAATGANQGDVGSNGAILRMGLDGSTTLLHSFSTELSNLVWQGILYGGWVRTPMNLNAEGAEPASLVQAADGTLYGALPNQGPDGGGSAFSMAPDGSNFNVLHTYGQNTPEAAASPMLVSDAGDGTVLVANTNELFQLQPAAPLSVTASFSPSTIALYQSSKLSWSSTGAASCKISGDYVKTLKTATATSGTRTVWTYSTKSRLPKQFFAVVNCVSADGKSVANTTATLTVQ